jgi:hypothetical protein
VNGNEDVFHELKLRGSRCRYGKRKATYGIRTGFKEDCGICRIGTVWFCIDCDSGWSYRPD